MTLKTATGHQWPLTFDLWPLTFAWQVDFQGLTGQVRFKEGRRSNITLDLLKLKREHLVKVGVWNSQNGLNISDPLVYYDGNTPNFTLIVMTNEVCLHFFSFILFFCFFFQLFIAEPIKSYASFEANKYELPRKIL